MPDEDLVPEETKEDDDPKETLHTITIDGREREVTETELIKMAQKGESADQRYQEAAQLRNEAKSDAEFRQLARSANAGDAQSYRQYLRALGKPDGTAYTEQDLDQAVSLMQTAQQGLQADDTEYDEAEVDNTPIPFERLEPQVQELLKGVHEERLSSRREEIYKDLQADLDTDPVLGHIVKGDSPLVKRVIECAKQALKERVVDDGMSYGKEARELAVQEARQFVRDLGIADAGPKGVPMQHNRAAPGLPPSPLATSFNVHSKEPTKLPNVTDPSYAEKLTQRMSEAALSLGVQSE